MGRRLERPERDAADHLVDAALAVWRHRYREARAVGLDELRAAVFADSTADVGELRRLAGLGASGEQIAAIVL